MSSAVEIEGLRKDYPGGVQALSGVSLRVEEGDFYALLGPNGAGKSTTIGVLSSLVDKTAGVVRIFGIDIDEDFPSAKRKLGVVPQEFNFNQFEMTRDVLITQAGYYGLPARIAGERADHYLRALGLWDKRYLPSRSLSGGMKRRLMIARALVHAPPLLILDEPTAGVDIELRRSMWEYLTQLNQAGTTIILTTHYLEEAELLCRNVGIIDQGCIVEQGSVKSLLSQLDSEVFVLDLEYPLETLPSVVLASDAPAPLIRIDDTTLEASLPRGKSLNDLFAWLSARGVRVVSMKNKTNRLEELFVRKTSMRGRA
ncbi:MAG: ABC transporter ATP-binding protein [Gammaproteobacteria bacterium]